jgi:hypothetical protein
VLLGVSGAPHDGDVKRRLLRSQPARGADHGGHALEKTVVGNEEKQRLFPQLQLFPHGLPHRLAQTRMEATEVHTVEDRVQTGWIDAVAFEIVSHHPGNRDEDSARRRVLALLDSQELPVTPSLRDRKNRSRSPQRTLGGQRALTGGAARAEVRLQHVEVPADARVVDDVRGERPQKALRLRRPIGRRASRFELVAMKIGGERRSESERDRVDLVASRNEPQSQVPAISFEPSPVAIEMVEDEGDLQLACSLGLSPRNERIASTTGPTSMAAM